jgi:hypothetical protein
MVGKPAKVHGFARCSRRDELANPETVAMKLAQLRLKMIKVVNYCDKRHQSSIAVGIRLLPPDVGLGRALGSFLLANGIQCPWSTGKVCLTPIHNGHLVHYSIAGDRSNLQAAHFDIGSALSQILSQRTG